jgi:hypothetical protein
LFFGEALNEKESMAGTIDSVHGIACPDENAVNLANLYASRLDKWVAQ